MTKEIKPVSSLASQYLDMTEIPASAAEREQQQGRTGARSTSGVRPMSSIERKRRNLGRAMLAAAVVGSGIFAWQLGREWDSEKERERLGRTVIVEEGFEGRWQRGQARFWDMLDYFNKPAWDPLLPEMLPPPHQKPYTLILSLDDLMIHSSWDREHGWRTAKRPGLDYFLAYLSQFYEIVLFTSQPPYTALPIVEKLDPYGIYILYKLFKDCCRFVDKENVKDLSYLGRDLKKVIMLDTDPKHFKLQPENAIHMPKWTGDRQDRDLVGMIPFLEAVAFYNIQDVRPLLTNYQGKHIPSAWAEFEAQQKKKLVDEWEAEQKKGKGKLGGGFGSMFGVGGSQARQEVGPPKTPLERFRDMAQQGYLEEQKYWADNKAAIEKQMKDDQEAQRKAMNSSIFNFVGAMVGMAPPPGGDPAILGGQGQQTNGAAQPQPGQSKTA